MPYINLKITLLLLMLIQSISCGRNDKIEKSEPNLIGGECKYLETKGEAVIKSITPIGIASPENPSVRVIFDFFPSDEVKSPSPQGGKLIIGSGENPNRKCIEEQGVFIGSHHPAILMIQTHGTCVPRIIKLTNFDENKC